MKFSPHGNINFTVLDNAIVNRPNQAFNREGIDILFEAIFSSAERASLTNWFLIEVLNDDALPTDDATQALKENYILARNKGCSGIKGVISNVVQRNLLENVSSQAGIGIEFFQSEMDAVDSLSV